MSKMPHECAVFTTGMLGKIWSVAPRTVMKWCDGGILPFHRLPHGGRLGNRRVTREHAIAFAKKHGMPTAVLTGQPDEFTILPEPAAPTETAA